VYHIVNVRVLVENFVESSLVRDIEFVERRALPTDELDAIDDFL
jgi:hypothetical protein